MRGLMKLMSMTVAVAATLSLTPATAPAQQTQSWSLVEVSGDALPVVVDVDDDCREEVVGGTLTLAVDGTWTLVTLERETCGGDVKESEDTEEGRYEAEGDRVRFFDEDGDPGTEEIDDDQDDEVDVEDLMSGTRAGTTMTVELVHGTATLLFRR